MRKTGFGGNQGYPQGGGGYPQNFGGGGGLSGSASNAAAGAQSFNQAITCEYLSKSLAQVYF